MSAKCCKFCGRTGTRMLYLPRSVFSHHPARTDEWACHDRQACGRRTAQIGQWIGKRVLYRQDADGTRWTIRRQPGVSSGPVYALTCEYRQHRVTSSHVTIEAAKAHCRDVERSWEARSMRDYAGGER